MSAVPNQRDWSKGELATSTEVNDNLRNPITFYRQRPMWLGQKIAATTAIGSSTGYADITWNLGESFIDNENMNVAGTTYVTIVRPGLYVAEMLVIFSPNTAGVRRGRIGVTRVATGVFSTLYEVGAMSSGAASFAHAGQTNEETTIRIHDPGTYYAAGDKIFFGIGQNSGSALTFSGTANGGNTWACVRWVASS